VKAGKRVRGEAGKVAGRRVSAAGAQCLLFEDCLPERLLALGLRDVERVFTHTNRTVMLSLSQRVLRIHRGYAFAPDAVLKAVTRFLNPGVSRRLRRDAEREFLEFPVQLFAPASPRALRRETEQPGDARLRSRLKDLHRRLNAQHFGRTLGEIPIRVSGRMRRRLGELAVDLKTGGPIEIAVSRRHVLRHPWSEVEHTMLHEMVHQWQAESGLRIDHGPTFRAKASEVGVLPAAKRCVSRAAGQQGGVAATP
jgi:hypothetical protein